MGEFVAVSCAGGKDSTAMLLLMLEKEMPIDCVLYADTGMEFPEMQAHIKKDAIAKRLEKGLPLQGYGWPGVKVRWCTGQLKTHLIRKEVNRLKKERQARHYIGIAADEPERVKEDVYPLVEWGITEAEALQICYDRGFDWGGLYEIYHRASCWCCPLQGIDELRRLRVHHPELWERLRELDRRALAQFGHNPLGQFQKNWTVERLEQRFAAEARQIAIPAPDRAALYAKRAGEASERPPSRERHKPRDEWER